MYLANASIARATERKDRMQRWFHGSRAFCQPRVSEDPLQSSSFIVVQFGAIPVQSPLPIVSAIVVYGTAADYFPPRRFSHRDLHRRSIADSRPSVYFNAKIRPILSAHSPKGRIELYIFLHLRSTCFKPRPSEVSTIYITLSFNLEQ